MFSIALSQSRATALFLFRLTKSRRIFYAQIECLCFHTAWVDLRHSPRLTGTGEVYQLPLAIGDHHLQLPIGLSGAARRVTKSAGCADIHGDDFSTGTTDHPDLEKRAVRRSRMALRFQV